MAALCYVINSTFRPVCDRVTDQGLHIMIPPCKGMMWWKVDNLDSLFLFLVGVGSHFCKLTLYSNGGNKELWHICCFEGRWPFLISKRSQLKSIFKQYLCIETNGVRRSDYMASLTYSQRFAAERYCWKKRTDSFFFLNHPEIKYCFWKSKKSSERVECCFSLLLAVDFSRQCPSLSIQYHITSEAEYFFCYCCLKRGHVCTSILYGFTHSESTATPPAVFLKVSTRNSDRKDKQAPTRSHAEGFQSQNQF